MDHHNRTGEKFVSRIKEFSFFYRKSVPGRNGKQSNRTKNQKTGRIEGKSSGFGFYIIEIMISPNSEVETSLALFIRRAKSLVTCFDEMAFCIAAMTRSAASIQPI